MKESGRSTPVESQRDESDLVRKAQAGDSAAFTEIVRRYQRCRRVCFRGGFLGALGHRISQPFANAFRQLACYREHFLFSGGVHALLLYDWFARRCVRLR